MGYASGPGLPTNDVPLMMNWRMVGTQLAHLMPGQIAWSIAIAGMILTILVALAIWTGPMKVDTLRYLVCMLGLLAATGAVAWHSHVPAAMVLIPTLLIFQAHPGTTLGNLLEWWVLMPAALYMVRLVFASLLHLGLLPNEVGSFLDFLAGIGLFVMNLVMLGWAARRFRSLQIAQA